MANGDQNNQGGPDSPLGMGAAGGLLALLGIGARRDFLTPTMAEVSRRSAERRRSKKEEEKTSKRLESQEALLDSLLVGPAGSAIKKLMEERGLVRDGGPLDPTRWEGPQNQAFMSEAFRIVEREAEHPAKVAIAKTAEATAFPGGVYSAEVGPPKWVEDPEGWEAMNTEEQVIAIAERKVIRAEVANAKEDDRKVVSDFRANIAQHRDREDDDPGSFTAEDSELILRGIGNRVKNPGDRAELEDAVRSLERTSARRAAEIQIQAELDNGKWGVLNAAGQTAWTTEAGEETPMGAAVRTKRLMERVTAPGNEFEANYEVVRKHLQAVAEGKSPEEFTAALGELGFGDVRINALAAGIDISKDYKTAREDAEKEGTLGDFISSLDRLGDVSAAVNRRAITIGEDDALDNAQRQLDTLSPIIGPKTARDLFKKTFNREGQPILTQNIPTKSLLVERAAAFTTPLDTENLLKTEQEWDNAMKQANIPKEDRDDVLKILRQQFDPNGVNTNAAGRDKNARREGQPSGYDEDDIDGPLETVADNLNIEPPTVYTGGAETSYLTLRGGRMKDPVEPSRTNVIQAMQHWINTARQPHLLLVQEADRAEGAASTLNVPGYKGDLLEDLGGGNEKAVLDRLKEYLKRPELTSKGMGWGQLLTSIGLSEEEAYTAITRATLAGQNMDLSPVSSVIYHEFPATAATDRRAQATSLVEQAVELGEDTPEGKHLILQAGKREEEAKDLEEKDRLRRDMRPLQAEYFSYLLPHLTTTGERAFDLDEEGVESFWADRLGMVLMGSGLDAKSVPTGMFKGIEDASLSQKVDMFERFLDTAAKKFLAEPGVAAKNVSEVLEESRQSLIRLRTMATNLQGSTEGRIIINQTARGQAEWALHGVKLGDNYDKINLPEERAYHWLLSALASSADVAAGRRRLTSRSSTTVTSE